MSMLERHHQVFPTYLHLKHNCAPKITLRSRGRRVGRLPQVIKRQLKEEAVVFRSTAHEESPTLPKAQSGETAKALVGRISVTGRIQSGLALPLC